MHPSLSKAIELDRTARRRFALWFDAADFGPRPWFTTASRIEQLAHFLVVAHSALKATTGGLRGEIKANKTWARNNYGGLSKARLDTTMAIERALLANRYRPQQRQDLRRFRLELLRFERALADEQPQPVKVAA